MNNDHLFRVSLKAVIRDEQGRILLVREKDSSHWDLPGGGMDYGETFEQALRRELYEEVGYEGPLRMNLRTTEEARVLRDRPEPVWQIKLIYDVTTENNNFQVGEHATAIQFVEPDKLRESDNEAEKKLYHHLV